MNERLPDFIYGLRHQRVLVRGDAMLDGFVEGACVRVCAEAPAQVVEVSDRSADANGSRR